MDVLHEYVGRDLVEVDELQETADGLVQAHRVVTVAVLIHAVTVLLAPHQRCLESPIDVEVKDTNYNSE